MKSMQDTSDRTQGLLLGLCPRGRSFSFESETAKKNLKARRRQNALV